jgi:hypothetical protein
MVIVFAFMTGLWCLAAHWLVSHRALGGADSPSCPPRGPFRADWARDPNLNENRHLSAPEVLKILCDYRGKKCFPTM